MTDDVIAKAKECGAEIARLKEELANIDAFNEDYKRTIFMVEAERDQFKDQVAVLVKELNACFEDMIDWASYAGEYFKDKHNLQGDIDRYTKVLSSLPQSALDWRKEVEAWAIEVEKARADQLGNNCMWLIKKIDLIHGNLCPEKVGTWQMRVEQVVEASIKRKGE
jgi:hypothetical protein